MRTPCRRPARGRRPVAALLAAAALGAAACGDGDPQGLADAGPLLDGATGAPDGAVTGAEIDGGALPADAAPPPGLAFADACKPGERLVVAAVGDVLLHEGLARQAYAEGHATLWAEVAPLIARADLAYANLEGPSAAGVTVDWQLVDDPGPVFDGLVYTGYPRFNYHGSVVPALLAAGFDVVSTANNHAVDRGPIGIDRTMDALEAGGLPFSGTKRRVGVATWPAVTESAGFRVAWLACTFSTNDPDNGHQVLACDEDGDVVEAQVRQLAARPDIDAVIVTPHGGDEYSHEPALRQRRLAERVVGAGATAVIGNHPHVVQPWEKRLRPDGREAFVIYSIGNFVSWQSELPRRASLVLYLVLVRAGGVTTIAGVRYVPTFMHPTAPYTLWPADRSPDPEAAEGAALVADLLDGDNAISSDPGAPIDLGCPP